MEESAVNPSDLHDPKWAWLAGFGPILDQVLSLDVLALSVCVHGDGHPLQIYNGAAVLLLEQRRGLVRLFCSDVLLRGCLVELRDLNSIKSLISCSVWSKTQEVYFQKYLKGFWFLFFWIKTIEIIAPKLK